MTLKESIFHKEMGVNQDGSAIGGAHERFGVGSKPSEIDRPTIKVSGVTYSSSKTQGEESMFDSYRT